MEVRQITYEGVSWNCEIGEATEKQFVVSGLREGQYAAFSYEDQVQLLKEAYRLIGLIKGGSQ